MFALWFFFCSVSVSKRLLWILATRRSKIPRAYPLLRLTSDYNLTRNTNICGTPPTCWLYTHFLLSHQHKKRQNSHKWRLAQCQMNGENQKSNQLRADFYFISHSPFYYLILDMSIFITVAVVQRRVFRVLWGWDCWYRQSSELSKGQFGLKSCLLFDVITAGGDWWRCRKESEL